MPIPSIATGFNTHPKGNFALPMTWYDVEVVLADNNDDDVNNWARGSKEFPNE